MYKLYTDAAALYHQNKTAAGILIIHNHKQLQIKKHLKSLDNHSAEFEACLDGFKILKHLVNRNHDYNSFILYYTDSKIVYQSLLKQYAKHYQKFVDQILIQQNQFNDVFNNWIPDTKNEGAHQLAQQALHSFK
ncbi:ribonuclease HI [Philodulcilactobacillus myokoensis]|uniref:Ribonuclease HI n=1 Tax=Philodulcilactobacillus myokoensis TaxID=2929573 RepID=A0A9W6B149_9LACO|nr:reverse transcriptase-like protein [Philodulcilactobacillus myokoensis]GLB46871.1 ribonuclease HI [Philodulcilactobacillus myokoensis]